MYYVYLITNLINNKKYVGITNNYKKRWANHKCNNDPSMAIAQAIKKYGKENFKFELLEKNLTMEEASEKEIELIQKLNTDIKNGKGYNIALGGMYYTNNAQKGEKNGMSILTEKEVRYIKDNRNLPEYVLYDEFSEKISYAEFKEIYHDKKWKHIKTDTPIYPYNLEFSNQFTSGNKLNYEEVVELRNQYKNKIFWKDAYKKYKDIYKNEMDFWNVYCGNRYKLVMPEVFTEENKYFQSSIGHSGENNGKAKITKEEVIKMRYEFENNIKTRKELQQEFANKVSSATINSILSYRTWKNI